MSEQRVAAIGQRQPEVLATAGGSGQSRPFSRAARSPAPGTCRRTARVQHLHPRESATDRYRSTPRRTSRPREALAPQSRGRHRSPVLRPDLVPGLFGAPAARLPSCCGRCLRRTAAAHTHAGLERFSWSGPLSANTYSGTPRPRPASSCRLVFQSRPAPRAPPRDQPVEEPVDELARHFEPDDIDSTESASTCRPGSKTCRGRRWSLRRDPARCARRGRVAPHFGQRPHVDHGGAQLGQLALGRSGWRWKSVSVTTSPSTASPRNSSRSFVGSPPFSYAYERWVRRVRK